MKDNENRLVEIETKLAFQEETIQELNKVIYQQQLQLDKMDTFVKQLRHRVNSGTSIETSNIDPAEDVPPHY